MNLAIFTKRFRPPCLLPRQRRTLWTRPYMVAPALVKKRFGNGKKLLALAPIMHRPNYYLVWIDDRWDLQNGDEWLNALDQVWEAISEEFGARSEDDEDYRWPEEDSAGGCVWWTARAEDVLTIYRRRKMRLPPTVSADSAPEQHS